MNKYYVTTPIYYVNAKPHIGTAYPTLAADVLARWHRQKGNDVHFLTGTAEHGSKIAGSAEKAGLSPQAFADQNVKYFKAAWQALNLSYDDFIRTTEDRHTNAVKIFFTKLKASGRLYEKDYEGLYCVGHEAFIKEAELDAQGNCPDHAKPPEKIREKNWFFKLSECQEYLDNLITSGEMKIEPESRRNEVLSFIRQGLEDIAVSRRTAKFALPLPWDDEQTIYVWLDELFNYCSAIGYESKLTEFAKWWPADLHLVGKDIIKFHCVIWPALLKAIGVPPPKFVFAHGFFTIDGQKISKSLGNAIDPLALTAAYGTDAIRYFLLRDIPFGNDGDFSHQRLKDRYNADLANGLGNLVSRVLNLFEKTGISPLASPSEAFRRSWDKGGLRGVAGESLNTISYKIGDTDLHLENLAFDQALESIWQVIRTADEYLEQTKPWELAKNTSSVPGEMANILSNLYQALLDINEQIAPFMPESHDKLTSLLAARPLKKPSVPLFARIL